jgi:hypothetical protein
MVSWIAPAALEAAAISPAAAATAAAPPNALTRFVHRQGPAPVLDAVQLSDGAVGVSLAAHFHEAEASRTPGFPIRDQPDLGHRPAVLREQIANLLL